MPLQNRVNPFGKIIVSPSRGTLMGNRGVIHKDKKIVAQFKNKFWITCNMFYKNTPRVMMTEKRWTELFIIFVSTISARSVSRRKSGRFVKEKQFCPSLFDHHDARRIFVVHIARNPKLVFKISDDFFVLVNHATIAHERTATWTDDYFSEWIDTIL